VAGWLVAAGAALAALVAALRFPHSHLMPHDVWTARLLLFAASSATLCRSSPPTTAWFVDPITVKVAHDRRAPFSSSRSPPAVDLAAQRGECERAQIWGWDERTALTHVHVGFSDLTAPAAKSGASPSQSSTPPARLAKEHWSYTQQGYVHAATSSRYKCIEDILTGKTPPPSPPQTCDDTPWGRCWTGCPYVVKNWSDPRSCDGGRSRPDGHSCNECPCNKLNTSCGASGKGVGHPCLTGWYPDPLLPVPGSGVPLIPRGFTQAIVLELCVPYGTTAGNYTGSINVSAASGALFTVPVTVEVWDIDLPRLNDSHSFNTAFNFNSNMEAWYPPGTPPEQTWQDWLPFLAHFRTPGDSIYLGKPRPLAEYKILAETGAKWMGMRDAGISFRPPSNGSLPPHYMQDVIAQLTPAMAGLEKAGLLNKSCACPGLSHFVLRNHSTKLTAGLLVTADVYGFDEMPEMYNQSVYEIFGGLKRKWPGLTTMAVLDWQTFPSDLPLDIWVDEYADYGSSPSYMQATPKEKLRQGWLASSSKKQFWWSVPQRWMRAAVSR
jgi:hypothetical protein